MPPSSVRRDSLAAILVFRPFSTSPPFPSSSVGGFSRRPIYSVRRDSLATEIILPTATVCGASAPRPSCFAPPWLSIPCPPPLRLPPAPVRTATTLNHQTTQTATEKQTKTTTTPINPISPIKPTKPTHPIKPIAISFLLGFLLIPIIKLCRRLKP